MLEAVLKTKGRPYWRSLILQHSETMLIFVGHASFGHQVDEHDLCKPLRYCWCLWPVMSLRVQMMPLVLVTARVFCDNFSSLLKKGNSLDSEPLKRILKICDKDPDGKIFGVYSFWQGWRETQFSLRGWPLGFGHAPVYIWTTQIGLRCLFSFTYYFLLLFFGGDYKLEWTWKKWIWSK